MSTAKFYLALNKLVIIFGSYAGRGYDYLESIAEYLRQCGVEAYTVESYFATFSPCPRRGSLEDSRYCVDVCDAAIFVFFRGETLGIDDTVRDAKSILAGLDQGATVELAHLDQSGRQIPIQLIFDSPARCKYMSTLLQNMLHGWVLTTFVDQKIVEGSTPPEVMLAMKRAARGFCFSVLVESH